MAEPVLTIHEAYAPHAEVDALVARMTADGWELVATEPRAFGKGLLCTFVRVERQEAQGNA
jgi:hypothetical protein